MTASNEADFVEKHYTIKELCARLGVSRSSIDRAVRSGKLKKIKFGKTTLFPASEVKKCLNANL